LNKNSKAIISLVVFEPGSTVPEADAMSTAPRHAAMGEMSNFLKSSFFISDTATIIVVNLYIRSFAKIDDVKMVKKHQEHIRNCKS
jgi:hypothetical protein